MPPKAVERSPGRSARRRRAGRLERPRDPAHGDYATNAALRLAPGKRPAGARGARRARPRCGVERAEVAGPGFVNLWSRAWYGKAWARSSSGRDYGGGWAAPRERVQVEMVSANPTGPITVASARNGAYGDSVARPARVRRPRGRARVLLQRRRRPDGPASASLGRGEAARGGAARGRLPRRVRRRSSRRRRATPCRSMLERIEATLERFRIHFDSWAKQSELERGCPRSCSPQLRPTRGTAPCGCARRHSATRRTASSSARPSGRPTYEAADVAYLRDKLERGFDRAVYVLGADHPRGRGTGTR